MSLQQQLGAGATPEQMNQKLGELLGALMPPGVTGEVFTVRTDRKQATQARAGVEIDPGSAPGSAQARTESTPPPAREELASDREKVGKSGD